MLQTLLLDHCVAYSSWACIPKLTEITPALDIMGLDLVGPRRMKTLKYGNGTTKTKVRNGSTEVKRLLPRLFLCGWGTPPRQERSGNPVCVYWFTWLQWTSQGLTVSQQSTEVRRKWEENPWDWESYLPSDLETGSWDLGLQQASPSSCHLHATLSGQTQPKTNRWVGQL